ncbi:MAG: ABC transporter ATP-binding protein [Planctomycetota bacterium]
MTDAAETAPAPPALARGEPVLVARALTKRYGPHRALDGLDLAVPRGSTYGLLGPNGAGKSTTLRILLGLVQPSSGVVELFGRPFARERLALLRRVGCLVEGPSFYPYLSGRDNLRWLGRLAGGSGSAVDAARVETCLEWVGLATRGGDRVGGYSTGMRQRLGLAAALLHDPELLILDEPLNGLDPPAVLLVRDLIRRLGREGKTILISSHVLHEVELVCDRVAIVRGGKVLAEGEVAALLRPDRLRLEVRIAADQGPDPGEVLGGLEAVLRHERLRDGAWEVELASEAEAPALNRALVEAGCAVSALIPRQLSLESLFHELTGGDARAGFREGEGGSA